MAKLNSNVPKFCASKFTWEGRLGTADASDLGSGFFKRLFDDAADLGFVVTSKRTGKQKVFCFSAVDNGPEGEPQVARFTSIGDVSESGCVTMDRTDAIAIAVWND